MNLALDQEDSLVMSFTSPPAFPPVSTLRRRTKGFSLVELLVVIAILAVIFVIGGMQITKAWKRQKLETAATNVRVIFQRALPEMQRRNMVTFVQVGPLVTSGPAQYLPIYLVGDANGNGAIDGFATTPSVASPDLLIDEYDIIVVGATSIKGVTGVSQDFCLSDDGTNLVKSTLWSYNLTDWANPRVLMCDFQGRTIDVTTGLQIVAPATLVLTHVDVVTGNFAPPTRFLLNINPVWSVRTIRQVNSSSTLPYVAANWVAQGG
jgi:prepilin-type N-terminal cleavage/methylation domain-containing protein